MARWLTTLAVFLQNTKSWEQTLTPLVWDLSYCTMALFDRSVHVEGCVRLGQWLLELVGVFLVVAYKADLVPSLTTIVRVLGITVC